MRQPLVPQNFVTPGKSEISESYYVEPILASMNEEDLENLLESAEEIVKVRGQNHPDRNYWPFKYTLEKNYKDLAWLELCHRKKQLFSYVIRETGTERYCGCLYIYPIELFYPEKAVDYDVDFSFWVTKPTFAAGEYPVIRDDLATWLNENWPFGERVCYRNVI